MTDDSPKTSWTCIVRAVDRSSLASANALSRLAELYRGPLLRLFRLKLGPRRDNDAEDWAHDFILSHLLSGKIFKSAKPVGRFRSYLAVAVRNYIYSRFEGELGGKGRADKPLPFSALSGEEFDPARVADGQSLQEYESVLAYGRAVDCVETAIARLDGFAAESKDPEVRAVAQKIHNREWDFHRKGKVGSPARKAAELFEEYLREAVRDEILLQAGEDPMLICGREIAILKDSLTRGSSADQIL